ncbi:hypothetical protein, partial [Clostridium sp. Maddingley MBC34-26]|uniref:hypothetical protein n=1 Tax=Clostridium sp. Maddingley MBC34-26 TaxID=1196322 RepID=UPI0025B92248
LLLSIFSIAELPSNLDLYVQTMSRLRPTLSKLDLREKNSNGHLYSTYWNFAISLNQTSKESFTECPKFL